MPFDGAHPTRFLSSLPADVNADFLRVIRRSQASYRRGRLQDAIGVLSRGYSALVGAQLAGERFHKGWALHQLGLWELEAGRVEPARQFFLMAFVEDVLTRQEHSPDVPDELRGPAAQMLVYNNLGVPALALAQLSQELRQAQSEGVLYQTPEAALQVHPLPPAPVPAEVDPYVPEWRELGTFAAGLSRRVFIGGSYRTERFMPALKAARDEARGCGFDGVLVAEFNNPTGMDMRRKSLICLMGCSRAIFELSEPSGHLVEFDKLTDFGIHEVLVVYTPIEEETRARISSLTRSWFGALGIEPRMYDSIPQLRAIVREWLPCGSEGDRAERVDRGASQIADRLAERVRESVRRGVSEFLGEGLDRADEGRQH